LSANYRRSTDADALLGRAVFEFKTDLRNERDDAEEELKRYLEQREAETGHRYVGIATDGADFLSLIHI